MFDGHYIYSDILWILFHITMLINILQEYHIFYKIIPFNKMSFGEYFQALSTDTAEAWWLQ